MSGRDARAAKRRKVQAMRELPAVLTGIATAPAKTVAAFKALGESLLVIGKGASAFLLPIQSTTIDLPKWEVAPDDVPSVHLTIQPGSWFYGKPPLGSKAPSVNAMEYFKTLTLESKWLSEGIIGEPTPLKWDTMNHMFFKSMAEKLATVVSSAGPPSTPADLAARLDEHFGNTRPLLDNFDPSAPDSA